jgi:aryl-alcohol dehydrogenase-like predicted oxidoreductase
MEKNILGKTNIEISRLGIGLAEIGYQLTIDDIKEAQKLLYLAIDNGINFFDTSSCYGLSEELIGKTISSRRNEYILATKCGHARNLPENDNGQYIDWAVNTLEKSIDNSLMKMNTDYVDLLQLHSCNVDILKQGDVIDTLLRIQQSGKTRFIGYSGDNESAEWAVDSGIFDTLQTSFNLIDQKANKNIFKSATSNNMGIIIKRPLANAAWGLDKPPVYGTGYADYYLERANKMIELGPLPDNSPNDNIELALFFVLAHNQVNTAIVGTKKPEHLLSNLKSIESGSYLSEDVIAELYDRFDKLGDDWFQQM